MAGKEKTYIGYVRVSSTDQNEARQLKALEDFGKPMHRIFIDKCSGKSHHPAETGAEQNNPPADPLDLCLHSADFLYSYHLRTHSHCTA